MVSAKYFSDVIIYQNIFNALIRKLKLKFLRGPNEDLTEGRIMTLTQQ